MTQQDLEMIEKAGDAYFKSDEEERRLILGMVPNQFRSIVLEYVEFLGRTVH